MNVTDLLRDAVREDCIRECDCPPYVSRCVHRGRFRVWLITREDSEAEYRRRLIEEGFSADEAITSHVCPKCGLRSDTRAWEAVAGVFGPAVKDLTYDCICRIPLFLTVRGLNEYAQAATDVEPLFDEAIARLVEVAP